MPSLGPSARVVNVASRAHKQGCVKIADGKIQGIPSHWWVIWHVVFPGEQFSGRWRKSLLKQLSSC